MTTIDEVLFKLTEWRATKQSRNDRIPQELRENILALRGHHADGEITKQLKLDVYYFHPPKEKKAKLKPKSVKFLKMEPCPSSIVTAPTVEQDCVARVRIVTVELGNGPRLRIESDDPFLLKLLDRLLVGVT